MKIKLCGTLCVAVTLLALMGLAPTARAQTITTMANFKAPNGRSPWAGLVADSNGNLFGTTRDGGTYNLGTVFEIPRDPNNTLTGYATSPTTLFSFTGDNGANPYAGLITDGNGNLFGTTVYGGQYNYGTVFEIPKDSSTATGYANAPTTLASFNGVNGKELGSDLLIDASGNLFGVATFGGDYGYGTVFEIIKTAMGYDSLPMIVGTFTYGNGSEPIGGLIADASGNLFGTTAFGGELGSTGTVFELTGSGFVPPKFAGTPGQANCTGVTVSTLANTYGGIAHAAKSLGYANVAALQSAVSSYCGQ